MPRVFIDGEAGTTGLGIRERLARLPIDIVKIDPARRKDPSARQAVMEAVDVAILCLPDDAAREAVSLADALGPRAPRLLDASTAHRTDPAWAYGFPELSLNQPEKIAYAARVANPGCYATAAIALLAPLVAAGLLPPATPITISAVSGYSGGGRAMIEAHEQGRAPAFEYYALGLSHKHLPEIIRYAGLATPPVFLPSVGHFRQGMIVAIPLDTKSLGTPPEKLHDTLAAHYRDSDRIAVLPPEPLDRLEPEALNGTDRMELRVAPAAFGHALLLARLDNLGKGASGAAVQNLLLMLGLPEPDGTCA